MNVARHINRHKRQHCDYLQIVDQAPEQDKAQLTKQDCGKSEQQEHYGHLIYHRRDKLGKVGGRPELELWLANHLHFQIFLIQRCFSFI